jgi:hypothetical protein
MDKKTQKKYHELSYEILPDTYYEHGYRVKFDSFTADYIYDIAALLASCQVDNTYGIICCGCEVMGCGGLYISTRIIGDEIVWEKFWNNQSVMPPDPEDELSEFDLAYISENKEDHLIIEPQIYFKFDQYKAFAQELERDAMKYTHYKKYLHDKLNKYLSGDTFSY